MRETAARMQLCVINECKRNHRTDIPRLHGVKMHRVLRVCVRVCQVSDDAASKCKRKCPRVVQRAHLRKCREKKMKKGKSTNSILSAYKFLAYHAAYPFVAHHNRKQITVDFSPLFPKEVDSEENRKLLPFHAEVLMKEIYL